MLPFATEVGWTLLQWLMPLSVSRELVLEHSWAGGKICLLPSQQQDSRMCLSLSCYNRTIRTIRTIQTIRTSEEALAPPLSPYSCLRSLITLRLHSCNLVALPEAQVKGPHPAGSTAGVVASDRPLEPGWREETQTVS